MQPPAAPSPARARPSRLGRRPTGFAVIGLILTAISVVLGIVALNTYRAARDEASAPRCAAGATNTGGCIRLVPATVTQIVISSDTKRPSFSISISGPGVTGTYHFGHEEDILDTSYIGGPATAEVWRGRVIAVDDAFSRSTTDTNPLGYFNAAWPFSLAFAMFALMFLLGYVWNSVPEGRDGVRMTSRQAAVLAILAGIGLSAVVSDLAALIFHEPVGWIMIVVTAVLAVLAAVERIKKFRANRVNSRIIAPANPRRVRRQRGGTDLIAAVTVPTVFVAEPQRRSIRVRLRLGRPRIRTIAVLALAVVAVGSTAAGVSSLVGDLSDRAALGRATVCPAAPAAGSDCITVRKTYIGGIRVADGSPGDQSIWVYWSTNQITPDTEWVSFPRDARPFVSDLVAKSPLDESIWRGHTISVTVAGHTAVATTDDPGQKLTDGYVGTGLVALFTMVVLGYLIAIYIRHRRAFDAREAACEAAVEHPSFR